MNSNILVTASAMSDQDLLARLEGLAGREREATAELVAHLAALDSRAVLYAAQGYGSLFTYCTQALRLSEDAACNRIEAARACRRFPLILDLLASGSLSLTSIRLPGPHLTAENHESVLAKAMNKSRREIEALQPHPRRLARSSRLRRPSANRVQFTIGQETHEKLRRLQALLRREIPDGDPGTIFDRALTVLLEKVQRTKLAAAVQPRPSRVIRPAADPRPPIRPAADEGIRNPALPSRHVPPAPLSRTVPREVKREVWRRDAGQCAFVSSTGRRCAESTFLELHHVQPYAKQGPATVANISLRCWRHNQYEAELIFGPHSSTMIREARPSFGLARSGPS